MHKLRGTVVGTLAVAILAAGLVGSPVGAAESGKVMFVNGWPGKRIDVCVGGKEVKSALPYGKQVFRKVAAGNTTIKAYRKDARTCRGTLLAKRSFDLPGGSDLSIVITSGAGQVQIFDNAGLGVLPAAPIAIVVRSAADFPAAIKRFGTDAPTPWSPAADPIWTKGSQYVLVGNATPDYLLTLLATEPDSSTAVAGPITIQYPTVDQKRFEIYLLGSAPANARLLVVSRAATFS